MDVIFFTKWHQDNKVKLSRLTSDRDKAELVWKAASDKFENDLIAIHHHYENQLKNLNKQENEFYSVDGNK